MATPPPGAKLLTPRATPLHESLLYAAQARYYADGGGAVFDGAIPSYITTNPFVAHTLATAILHAWRDLRDAGALAADGPLRVLELGAGSGRLGVCVLRELLARCRAARLDPSRVVYVMTDGNERSVREWAANPALAPLLAAGSLQLGVFDIVGGSGGSCATADGGGAGAAPLPPAAPHIRLLAPVEGAVLMPADFGGGSTRGAGSGGVRCSPLIVLGSYLFDSLPMDVLRVTYQHTGGAVSEDSGGSAPLGVDIGGGVAASLQRGLLALSTDDRALAADPTHPRLLRRMITEWAYAPFAPSSGGHTGGAVGPYAADAHLRAVADWYAAHAHEAGDCVDDGYRSALLDDDYDDNGDGDGGTSDSASSTGSRAPPPLPLPSTVPLPLGAFHCLRLLQRLSVGDDDDNEAAGGSGCDRGPGFLMLTIDKGVSNPATYVGAGAPDIHVHGGGRRGDGSADGGEGEEDDDAAAFSLMVNFHALELYTRALGGDALVTPDDDVNVKTAVLAVLPRPGAGSAGASGASVYLSLAADLPLLADTFSHSIAVFGPSEWLDLQKAATTPLAAAAGASGGTTLRAGSRAPAAAAAVAAAAAAASSSDSDDATVPASLIADADAADNDAASAASPMFVTSDTDGEGDHSGSDSGSDSCSDSGGDDGGQMTAHFGHHFSLRGRRRPYRAAHRTAERAHYADGSTGNVGPVCDATGRLTFPPADTSAAGWRTGEDDAALAARAAAEQRAARRRHAVSAPVVLPLSSVRAVTALLRLSRWDPALLPPYRDLLGRRLRYLTPPRRAALLDGLHM